MLSNQYKTYFYYINTNEIPGELSRETLISSHVKILPLVWHSVCTVPIFVSQYSQASNMNTFHFCNQFFFFKSDISLPLLQRAVLKIPNYEINRACSLIRLSALRAWLTRLCPERSVSIRKKYPLEPRVTSLPNLVQVLFIVLKLPFSISCCIGVKILFCL